MAYLSKPKPLAIERHEKRAKRTSHEKSEKEKVRRRDRHCRWPSCECRALKIAANVEEVAHLEAKGMGGDKLGIRTQASKMMLLCHLVHQGPNSLHSGDKRIAPLTAAGTDGPCAFDVRTKTGQWVELARETAIGVYR